MKIAQLMARSLDFRVLPRWRPSPMSVRTSAVTRASLRRLLHVDPKSILHALTTRQFVRPHDSLNAALLHVGRELGFATEAMDQSARWLGLDLDRPIGRLR